MMYIQSANMFRGKFIVVKIAFAAWQHIRVKVEEKFEDAVPNEIHVK
jgi:hypothetical protein